MSALEKYYKNRTINKSKVINTYAIHNSIGTSPNGREATPKAKDRPSLRMGRVIGLRMAHPDNGLIG